MNKITFVLLAIVFSLSGMAQSSAKYRFTLNLAKTQNDQLAVELLAPTITQPEIVYYLPKMIPGYYFDADFGRFVEDLRAYDKKGNALPVTHPTVNSWQIGKAQQLHRLTYRVNDTYDMTETSQVIFEPCGSNIQPDTNFLINNHCFLGYFGNMKQLPYELTIKHPKNLYGTTAMEDADPSPVSDRFTAESYNRIVDNPIMYAAPDTANIQVGNSKVVIGVYSPNKKVSAKFFAANFNKLLQAQAQYLGGKLPVKKYAFLIYLTPNPGVSGLTGALEHSYSSAYFSGEDEPEAVLEFFMDAAAHEFFHILTPLGVHSEEIHYFDFNQPKLSKHLWLYEGTTEYHAYIARTRYGLLDRADFLKAISQKTTSFRFFYNDSVALTEISKGILKNYADQFLSIYDKGAITALCLDIELHRLSGGKYGLIDLVLDLSKKYGKDKPFKDDELFGVIGKMTYPEIQQFLENYVAGNKRLPLKEILFQAGIDLQEEVETKDSLFTLGSNGYWFNNVTGRWFVNSPLGINEFGKKAGLQFKDELVAVNGKEVSGYNFGNVVTPLLKQAKTGDSLALEIDRPEPDGSYKRITINTTLWKIPVRKYNIVSFIPNPTPAQAELLNSWLNPKK